jgi:2-oxoisovalerate dehydrogenase E1 component
MVDAINRCYKEAMARDVRICLFGEDVASGRPEILGRLPGKGGVFGVTQGLQELYGDRVHNTQLAESYIVGSACGKALRGLIPIGEIQFGDFVWDAMAQIKKEIATMCWRTAGKWAPHMVVYVPVGYVHGGSIWHSEDVSSIFTHITGLRIPYPSNAADAVGLMNTALFHCQDPVLFCAHKGLYQAIASRAPYPGEGYTVPFGCANILRDGTHCTIVTWGAMVHTSLGAAEALAAEDISVEVIDLRTIAPVDWEAIAQSVEKTGHLVIVHEDTLTSGFGAELAARAAQDLFWALDGPIQRVASVDAYVPYDPKLVSAYLPGIEDICRAVRSAMA